MKLTIMNICGLSSGIIFFLVYIIQSYHIYKIKKTNGISLLSQFIVFIGLFLFTVFGILGDFPQLYVFSMFEMGCVVLNIFMIYLYRDNTNKKTSHKETSMEYSITITPTNEIMIIEEPSFVINELFTDII